MTDDELSELAAKAASEVSNPNVTIARLRRRIERLKRQRDHFREQMELRQKMIDIAPYIEWRWKAHTDAQIERARVKQLEQRVREQAMLIERLTKENNDAAR